MCGIVGAISKRQVSELLTTGLKRLEYRGYDSAGLATIDTQSGLSRCRALGKVDQLISELNKNPLNGNIGIAHTRWATHGEPSVVNAHPHMSNNRICVVHNGIIENHVELRQQLELKNYTFESATDTEVLAHALDDLIHQGNSLLKAVQLLVKQLKGAYGLAALDALDEQHIVVARSGSPLVLGVGIGENYICSDPLALRMVTDRFIYLEEDDIAEVGCDSLRIFHNDELVERPVTQIDISAESSDKGSYRHYMLKEIFEQPRVLAAGISGRLQDQSINLFSGDKQPDLAAVKAVQIVACGSSYITALTCKYWIEELCGIPCNVEIASEYRYKRVVVLPATLFVTISQSGETADTLAALKLAKTLDYLSYLCICNVETSSLARESDHMVLTKAGPEIGVASTKAFTAQLMALFMLSLSIARHNGLDKETEKSLCFELGRLPELVNTTLGLNNEIKAMANSFGDKHNALFLGRGLYYPLAIEGALKLKEISYIHAEAYAAGELKHGPLALVDDEMPVVAVAPNDALLEKLKSNLQEVRARGGRLFIFADPATGMHEDSTINIIHLPTVHAYLAPIVYAIPLQLLAYHVALLKGTDVDQPRNLAKSVTVE